MRQTSATAYNEIKNSGLLSKRRFEVYQALYLYGPMTANELIRHFKVHRPEGNQTSYNARFSELERMGVIKEVGTKKDDVSGNECILWDCTDALPGKLVKLDRKKLKKQLIEKIASLGVSVDENLRVPLREIYKLANSI